jgi:predicted enzyme related to lactoylglutathione lyase
MAQTITKTLNRPSWVDLSSSDAEASRAFYARVFGWDVEVNEDPQYGGYALARIGGKDAAGIGPKMDPNAPTAWNVYIGTDDIDGLARRVSEAGGTALMAPFDVGDQGRMAVFQDPTGAVISAWQGTRMGGFETDAPNSFGWAELNARGVDKALPFYETVFGWTVKKSDMGEGQPPYNEFQIDGQSIGGAWEMNPMVPAEVPSYWQIYFTVDDVDDTFRRALAAGATEMLAPQDFPGGRFAILADPQGASIGLLKQSPRS